MSQNRSVRFTPGTLGVLCAGVLAVSLAGLAAGFTDIIGKMQPC